MPRPAPRRTRPEKTKGCYGDLNNPHASGPGEPRTATENACPTCFPAPQAH